MAIEIKHEPHDGRGAFRAYDDRGPIGSMVYVKAGEKVAIVQHTGVEARGRGQGIAKQLFDFMVGWARETETKIVPQCAFARKRFHELPEAKDVLR